MTQPRDAEAVRSEFATVLGLVAVRPVDEVLPAVTGMDLSGCAETVRLLAGFTLLKGTAAPAYLAGDLDLRDSDYLKALGLAPDARSAAEFLDASKAADEGRAGGLLIELAHAIEGPERAVARLFAYCLEHHDANKDGACAACEHLRHRCTCSDAAGNPNDFSNR